MKKGFESINIHGCANAVIPVPAIGENGNWFIGNDDTEVCVRGEKGENGEAGPQGLKGEQGDVGPAGAQGIQGIQGIQGEQGIKGDRGNAGEQGTQGLQGARGEQGPKGDKGDIGPVGPQGEQGSKGTDADSAELERLSDEVVKVNQSLNWYIDNGILPPMGYKPNYDLVPQLSANNQDGYIASCSSVYHGDMHKAYMAFDNIGSTRWASMSDSSPEYIQIAFPRTVYINSVIIDQYRDSYGIFKDFTIKTSLDGNIYQTVFTGTHPQDYVVAIANFTTTAAKYLKIEFKNHYSNMVTITQITIGGYVAI